MEILNAGGPVMYIIILCSVIALGFIIERFLAYRNAHCDMDTFFPPVENAIKLGKMDEALQYCEKSKGLIPRVLAVGFKNREENIEDLRRILIDEVQIHILPKLQKHLAILATIARGTPMLGLLGTVLGMINMFEVITRVGLGDPQKMAEGIQLALVTTAGGLIVAIPIVFIHAYFKGQIRNFELDLYHYLTRFLRLMRRRQEVGQQDG